MKYFKSLKFNLILCLLLSVQPVFCNVQTIWAIASVVEKVYPFIRDALVYINSIEEIHNEAQKSLDKYEKTSERQEYSSHSISFNDLNDLRKNDSANISNFTQNLILSLNPTAQKDFHESVVVTKDTNRSICPEKTNPKDIIKSECLPKISIVNSNVTNDSQPHIISTKIPKLESKTTSNTNSKIANVIISHSTNFGKTIIRDLEKADYYKKIHDEQKSFHTSFKANVLFKKQPRQTIKFENKHCRSYIENLINYIYLIIESNSDRFSERLSSRLALFELKKFQGLIPAQTDITNDLTDQLINTYFSETGELNLEQDAQATKIILDGLSKILNLRENKNAYKISNLKLELFENSLNVLQICKEKKLYLSTSYLDISDIKTSYISKNTYQIEENLAKYSQIINENIYRFKDFITTLDYQNAKQFAQKANSSFEKKLRFKLLNEYFTENGFLKSCAADPFFKSLSQADKQFISSDTKRLKIFNEILLQRHHLLLKNIDLFVLDNNNDLTAAQNCLKDINQSVLQMLYKLTDCVNNRNAQIDILSEILKNKDLNPDLYNTFFQNNFLKFNINQFKGYLNHQKNLNKHEIYNTYTKILSTTNDVKLISTINKCAYLDFSNINNEIVSKARTYLFSYVNENSADGIERKFYFDYAYEIILSLINKKNNKILQYIPEIPTKANRAKRFKELQFIASTLDEVSNGQFSLKSMRAFLLTENSDMYPYLLTRAYQTVEYLKSSPISKLKAKECLERILACEVTIKNKQALQDALWDFNQISKVNDQGIIDAHLQNSCQILDQLEKKNLIYCQDIDKENLKIKNTSVEEQKKISIDQIEQKTTVEQTNEKIKKLLEGTITAESKRYSQNYKKKGNYDKAVNDFYSAKPENVSSFSGKVNGFEGDLPDGRTIKVRDFSSYDEKPTLEILDKITKKYTKIRYFKD